MEVTVTTKQNWRRTVEVVVPIDEIQPELEKGYKKYQKTAKVQGFRKGKVPLHLIKRLYGPQIEAEVIEELVPQIVSRAWRQENLRPVTPPKVENLDYSPGRDLRVTFSIDIEPEFQVERFEGFKLTRNVYEVTEEDVQEALDDLRENNAVWETVEGEIDKDHFVLIDAQEIDLAGLPIIGEKVEDRLLRLVDDNGKLTELGGQLVGAKAGEQRIVEVAVEDEQGHKTRKRYEVRIREVKRRILPELDDEFARDVGEYESLEALKASLAEQIRQNIQRRLDAQLDHELIDEIIKNNPFDLPESMIERSLDYVVREYRERYRDQQLDESMIREHSRADVIRDLKWALISEKLIKQLGIEASDEEVQREVRDYAKRNGIDPERVWNQVKNNEEMLRKFRDGILSRKLMEILKSKQKIKEKKVRRKDLEQRRIVTA